MTLHDLFTTPFIRTVVLVPVTLLPIVNPIANVPLFVTMLGNADDRIVRHVSRLVSTYCFVMVVAAILLGAHVLGFFGVSLPVVRVAGGLLVAASGWRLLGGHDPDSVRPQFVASYGSTAPPDAAATAPVEAAMPGVAQPDEEGMHAFVHASAMSEDELRARSFYPISFPLTVGPGTISASIAIGTEAPSRALDWIESIGGVAVGAAVTGIAIYFCYRYAGWLTRSLGSLGTVVLRRLSAFILLCIGVELVWSGVDGLLSSADFLSRMHGG